MSEQKLHVDVHINLDPALSSISLTDVSTGVMENMAYRMTQVIEQAGLDWHGELSEAKCSWPRSR